MFLGQQWLQRFQRGDESFFLKRHSGIGWWEIIKDLLQGRLPVLGADNEWQAIQRLQILNVSTLHAIAFGQQGRNPARQQSFIREIPSLAVVPSASVRDVVPAYRQS